jgi:hypothetical protein
MQPQTVTILLTIRTLMQAVASCKMFHWSTTIFAAHQASGDLANSLFAKMDALVEAMLSKTPKGSLQGQDLQMSITSSTNFPSQLELMTQTLRGLDGVPEFSSSEILNLRDDILSSVDQYKYLAKQFA